MDAIGFDAYNCVIEVIGADIYNLALTGDKACSLTSEGWTSTGTCPKVLILDHHPADSRTDIASDQNTIQTLTSRMGTGGGNVPMILEPIPLEGNRARPSHFGSGYRDGGAMYSLNTTEVHAVAYAFEPGILKREGAASRVSREVSPTLRNNMGG